MKSWIRRRRDALMEQGTPGTLPNAHKRESQGTMATPPADNVGGGALLDGPRLLAANSHNFIVYRSHPDNPLWMGMLRNPDCGEARAHGRERKPNPNSVLSLVKESQWRGRDVESSNQFFSVARSLSTCNPRSHNDFRSAVRPSRDLASRGGREFPSALTSRMPNSMGLVRDVLPCRPPVSGSLWRHNPSLHD
jgi:hypothetical protein